MYMQGGKLFYSIKLCAEYDIDEALCWGSGSGSNRIRTFLPDPDPEIFH
jgi:hypothetical protein